MGKVRGQDVVLYKDNYGTYVPLGCARSITFDIEQDMIETSIKGDARFRSYIPGAISWSGSIEGLVFIEKEVASIYGMGQMYDDIILGNKIYLRWYEQDEEGLTFLVKQGYAYIESINETSSFDNMATFTATFKGTGTITIIYGDTPFTLRPIQTEDLVDITTENDVTLTTEN